MCNTVTRKETVLKIVIPCYNEQEAIPYAVEQLLSLLDDFEQKQIVSSESGLILVDDGSKDGTWNIINDYCKQYSNIIGVKLSRNCGHQNALMAGLQTAQEICDCCVSIDADLQDDIKVIEDMVDKFNNEACDIVYGVRKNRTTDTWFKRTTAQGFYKVMTWLGGDTVYNHADYRLMSKRAIQELMKYGERNLFLRGLVPMIGFKADRVYYDRNVRVAGESKYPLRKMISFAVDGITSFSVKPVRIVLSLGFFFVVIALGILVYVIITIIQGKAVSGWASLILSLWFIGGCVLISLGILGEYIGKIYIEVKNRPRFVIETVTGLHEKS